MKAIPLNIGLAVFWAALNDDYRWPSLVVGYVIGWALTYLLYTRIDSGMPLTMRLSPRKLWRSIAYAFRLAWEIWLAGMIVTSIVFRRRLALQPGIIAVPADVKGDVEVTLLANSITLTPGTWTLDVPADQGVLYVHALDVPDSAQTKLEIKERLEKFIVEAGRC